MKRLYTLTLLAFIISISTVNAQMTFGPKIGGNFSKLNWKEGENNESDPNYEYQLGWQVGGILDFQLSEMWSIRPGINLNRKSTKFKTDDPFFDDVETKLSTTYIQVPVNLVLSLPVSHYHLKLSAGPYFQRGISGKVVRELDDTSNEKDILFKEQPDDYDTNDGDVYLNPWDFGINFGIGYQIEYFLISLEYDLGLSNIATKYETEPDGYSRSDQAVSRWSSFTLSVAYLFHPEQE